MCSEPIVELVNFLDSRVGENLRGVTHYYDGEYDIEYIRDDVAEQYAEDEIDAVIQDLGIEAFGKSQQEDIYVHGDLNCTVRCFDDAIEMNFLISEREGVAVSLDSEAFVVHQTFVGKCLEIMDLELSR